MSNLIDIVRSRRSIRRYRPDPVPREMIESCIEAARYAPTTCNTQGWRFVVAEGGLKRELAGKALGGLVVPNKWAENAPVIVVLAIDLNILTHRIGAGIKGIDYHLLDAGIAGEHLVLRAAELGLGTCWIGWFDKKVVKKLLELPAGWDVAALIALGFPDEEPGERKRRPLDEIMEFRT